MFDSEKGLKAIGNVFQDPSSPTAKADDYILSALIRVDEIYASINVTDYQFNNSERWTKVLVHLLDVENTYKPELGRSTWRCQYDFTSRPK